LHHYPDAPEKVSYLRNIHRHLFKFKVYIEVFSDDRDVEFIMFKEDIEKWLGYVEQKLICKSCEMMSDFLYAKIIKKYKDRDVKIEVSEDGENGSFNEYLKNQ